METVIEVLGVLLQVVGDGTLTLAAEPIRMTIEECLARALEINISEAPFIMMCSPIVEGVGV